MTENNNAELIKDLEDFILYLESRPELPKIKRASASIYVWEKEDFVNAVRKMGAGEKKYSEIDVEFNRHFGSVTLRLWGLRETVCQRVQVGTKVVKSFEIKPEFKGVDIGDYVDKEEPVYEWKCPESLLEKAEV